MCALSLFGGVSDMSENYFQVFRKRTLEVKLVSTSRMCKSEPTGVEKRSFKTVNHSEMGSQMSPFASVGRIRHYWM
ncbi:uncharacterized protein METZ01_LOCUS474735, partial [marine metagenome]